MSTKYRVCQLEACDREMFGDLVLTCPSPATTSVFEPPTTAMQPVSPIHVVHKKTFDYSYSVDEQTDFIDDKRRASDLVEELLVDIYRNIQSGSDYNSAGSSHRSRRSFLIDLNNLHGKGMYNMN